MARPLYNALFFRNWQMLGAVFGAGFAFELGFNQGMNKFWDNMNRGVSANPLAGLGQWWLTNTQRQWKDIRQKYVAQEEDDE